MKRMTLRAALVAPAAALTMVSGPAALAAPGDLDPTFGTSGVVVVDQTLQTWALDLAVQADGKVVGVGEVYGVGPSNDALAFRLNADGSRDPQFGIRRLDGPGGGYESANSVVVQPDGKIVVAGSTSQNGDGAVWRLLPNGAPDPSFAGGDGLALVDSGGDETLTDVAVAPDGAIVVVGRSTVQNQATIYRLTPSGGFDDSFDKDGALGIGGSGSSAAAVAVQPDGKILVAGRFAPSYGMLVRRLTVSGTDDLTFGEGDGEARILSDADAHDLLLQPDGRIVVAGRIANPNRSDALVLRYTAAGILDASFGSTIGTRVDLGGEERLDSVALTPGGGVVATGTTDAGEDAIVVKLDDQGRPDPAFGAAGTVVLPGSIKQGEGVGAQPDGRIVIAGGDEKAASSAVVYRLLGDYQPAQPEPVVRTCRGKKATVVGTAGKDRITGTRKADVIVALGGNDLVKGLGGNDLVCGGDGNDAVKGGPGKDHLLGEKGKDQLLGGTGRDRLVGWSATRRRQAVALSQTSTRPH